MTNWPIVLHYWVGSSSETHLLWFSPNKEIEDVESLGDVLTKPSCGITFYIFLIHTPKKWAKIWANATSWRNREKCCSTTPQSKKSLPHHLGPARRNKGDTARLPCSTFFSPWTLPCKNPTTVGRKNCLAGSNCNWETPISPHKRSEVTTTRHEKCQIRLGRLGWAGNELR